MRDLSVAANEKDQRIAKVVQRCEWLSRACSAGGRDLLLVEGRPIPRSSQLQYVDRYCLTRPGWIGKGETIAWDGRESFLENCGGWKDRKMAGLTTMLMTGALRARQPLSVPREGRQAGRTARFCLPEN